MPGPPGDVRVVFLTHPTVRNTDPNVDDWGVVSRVITSILGPLVVQEIRPFGAIKTTIAPVTMPGPPLSTLIITANPATGAFFSGGRRGLYIYNNSQVKFLYLRLVAGPVLQPPAPIPPPAPLITQGNFTLRLPPQSDYVVPFPIFTGFIFGAFAPGPVDAPGFGNVQVTELF